MAKSDVLYRGQSVTRAQLALNRQLGVKHCFGCHETKPTEAFSRDKSRSDGLQPRCKACYATWKASRRGPPKPLLTDEEKRNRRKARRLKNRDKYLCTSREWMRANKQKFDAYSKAWRIENADRNLIVRQAYTAQNQERIKLRNKEYRQANRARVLAHIRDRQCRKLNASPAWVDKTEILKFYIDARRLTKKTGVLHHVDHIYPLKSKTMCGLHVPANLQVLTAAENIAKNNRSWPGKEEDAYANSVGIGCS